MSRSSPRSHAASGISKPCFGRWIDRGRHAALEIALEQVLRRAAAVLEVGRDRGGELDHLVVQEGRAHLERGRHAHPVDLDQDVVGEPGLEVHVEELAQRVEARARASKCRANAVEGIVAAEVSAELGRQERRLVGRAAEERQVAESRRARTWCRDSAGSSGRAAGAAASPPWGRRGRGGRARRAADQRGQPSDGARPPAGSGRSAAGSPRRPRRRRRPTAPPSPARARPATRSRSAARTSRRRARRGARPGAAGSRRRCGLDAGPRGGRCPSACGHRAGVRQLVEGAAR